MLVGVAPIDVRRHIDILETNLVSDKPTELVAYLHYEHYYTHVINLEKS
jgi:hypothetical protein